MIPVCIFCGHRVCQLNEPKCTAIIWRCSQCGRESTSVNFSSIQSEPKSTTPDSVLKKMIENCIEFAKTFKQYKPIVRRLDENGHAYCGCGSKGVPHFSYTNYCRDPISGEMHLSKSKERTISYWIRCDNNKCRCSVGYTDGLLFRDEEDAWLGWDRAMGIVEVENDT